MLEDKKMTGLCFMRAKHDGAGVVLNHIGRQIFFAAP
jgi:hypothetical protein